MIGWIDIQAKERQPRVPCRRRAAQNQNTPSTSTSSLLALASSSKAIKANRNTLYREWRRKNTFHSNVYFVDRVFWAPVFCGTSISAFNLGNLYVILGNVRLRSCVSSTIFANLTVTCLFSRILLSHTLFRHLRVLPGMTLV